MAKLATRCAQLCIVPFPIEASPRLFLDVTEHYEDTDGAQRTDHYTFDIRNDDRSIDLSVPVSPQTLMRLSHMFAAAGTAAYEALFVEKQ